MHSVKRIFLTPALLLLLAGAGLPTPTSHAAAYLKFEGIDGEATSPAHDGWIDVLSVQTGIARTGTRTGPHLSPLHVTKPVDKATPLLYRACATGDIIPRASLELVRAEGKWLRYYRIVLENVIVSSIQTGGSAAGHPEEEVDLDYSKITWTHTETDPTGSPVADHRAYWDLLRNEGEFHELPPFRVSGSQTEPGQLRLSWPAEAGQSYRIRSTADLGDSFADVDEITAESDGPIEIVLPVIGSHRFFFVEEAR
jgi:type VI secretion system secreted protein Hcp